MKDLSMFTNFRTNKIAIKTSEIKIVKNGKSGFNIVLNRIIYNF